MRGQMNSCLGFKCYLLNEIAHKRRHGPQADDDSARPASGKHSCYDAITMRKGTNFGFKQFTISQEQPLPLYFDRA